MSDYSGNDIYCDMIIPGKTSINIIKETENVLAYEHTKPHWPTHIVVTPKHHVPSLLELNDVLAREVLLVIKELAARVNNKSACRVITNLGDYQDSKHLHFHICSGDPLD